MVGVLPLMKITALVFKHEFSQELITDEPRKQELLFFFKTQRINTIVYVGKL